MKKTLVALALAAIASTSYATVAGSAHDFNASTTYTTNKASRCQYCHVPHNAATWAETGLWATQEVTGYTLFTGVTTISASKSKTCLACHYSQASAPQDLFGNDVLQQGIVDAAKVLGDLDNDHPIGDNVEIDPGNSLQDYPLVLGRRTFKDETQAGFTAYDTLQCATCHSVHGNSEYTISGRKLLYGPGSTGTEGVEHPSTVDFCNICHTR